MPAMATDTAPAPAAQALLQRLEWTVIRRLDGLLQGDYRTLLRGTGLDLADLREYQHHDDVRHIDWNVTARLQLPHVRVFTEDREMAAWFVLDLSASVDFGSGQRLKAEVAQEFVGVLARLLTRHGNRVGGLLFGGAGTGAGEGADAVVPARSGRSHVLRLLHSLQIHEEARRELRRSTERSGSHGLPQSTRLGAWLRSAAKLIPRRSTVFVVSDFISEKGWEQPLGQLAQRHEVVAVRLFDPLELDLPDLGLLSFRDAETGEQLLVDTHDAGFRQRFARLAAAREDALREAFGRAGIDALELATDQDMVESLTRFTELRKRRTHAGRGLARHGGGLPSHLRRVA
jgi:uncharacterized protein (DUF58 family)